MEDCNKTTQLLRFFSFPRSLWSTCQTAMRVYFLERTNSELTFQYSGNGHPTSRKFSTAAPREKFCKKWRFWQKLGSGRKSHVLAIFCDHFFFLFPSRLRYTCQTAIRVCFLERYNSELTFQYSDHSYPTSRRFSTAAWREKFCEKWSKNGQTSDFRRDPIFVKICTFHKTFLFKLP